MTPFAANHSACTCSRRTVYVSFSGLSLPGQDQGLDPKTAASNHSPLFQGDDHALPVGVRAMSNMALDFLRSGGVAK